MNTDRETIIKCVVDAFRKPRPSEDPFMCVLRLIGTLNLMNLGPFYFSITHVRNYIKKYCAPEKAPRAPKK